MRAQFEPPWAIDVRDDAAMTVIAVLSGQVQLRHGTRDEPLNAGDVALVQGGRPYIVSDRDGSSPSVRILPGNQCVDLAGHPVAESMSHGLRTWGNARSGKDALLIGAYGSIGKVGRLLVQALPEAVVTRNESAVSGAVSLMEREIARAAPGQASLLDRLLDVVLVGAVRSYAVQSDATALSYLTTQDTLVGSALESMHERLAHRWTVASLAHAAHTSRATLNRRFRAAIGTAPMTYLTNLRLAMAADLLCDPSVTVASVAHDVGYATPFALSAALKRRFGLSPREFRATAAR